MKQFKIVVEKHPDTYVAYPLSLKGVVIGQGDSYESALEDVKSAIKFHFLWFVPIFIRILNGCPSDSQISYNTL